MDNESNSGIATGLGCLLLLAFVAYGILSLYAGWVGIEHHFGSGWATGAVVAGVFGFTPPMCVGAFFCAKDVWGWPWLGAFVFAAPGLAFMALMVPGAMAGLLAKFRR